MPIDWEVAAKGFVYPVLGVGGDLPPYDNGYRVIDGDTIEVLIDQGFKGTKRINVRPRDLDVPEMKTVAGQLVKQCVQAWLANCDRLWAVSTGKDGRGRVLGDLFDDNGYTWTEYLYDNGFCKLYDGDGRRPGWSEIELGQVEELATEWLDFYAQIEAVTLANV